MIPSPPAGPIETSRRDLLDGFRAIARASAPILLGAIVVFGAWKVIVVVGNYPPFILPAPETIAARLVGAWADGLIQPHLATTLSEIVLGFLVGAVVGIVCGFVLARSAIAAKVLSPYIVAAQATPLLALAPLIALWFGSGLLSKVVICALTSFFPIAVSTLIGFRNVDPGLLEMSRSFRGSSRQILRVIELPAALPSILGGLRIGVTLAVIGSIVGEWAGGESGLGVLINLARGSLFDTPLLFATLFTIGILGIVLYLIVVFIERLLLGDRGINRETS